MKRTLVLLMGGCFCYSVQAELQLEDGYVTATLAGAPTSAAYLTLSNTDPEDWVLTGAEAESMTVMLHSQQMQGNMMQMRHLSEATVPAGGKLSLQPGGNHLMLMGLNAPLVEGQRLSLTLTFRQHPPMQISLPVKNINQAMEQGHH